MRTCYFVKYIIADQSGVALPANVVAGAILVVSFWTVTPRVVLISWLIVLAALMAVRGVLLKLYRSAAERGDHSAPWLLWFLVGAAATGTLWGFTAMIFVPDGTIDKTAIVALWVCGLSAGSVAALGVFRRAFLAFSAPAMIPLAIHLLLRGGVEATMLGGAMVMFFGFLNINAARMHATLVNALNLQYQNELLISDLNAEKLQVEALNADLEDRVAARTAEVVHSNRQLQSEINERELTQVQLRQSLHEKDVLMREVHHRVKNNFQIIISLLNLQSRQVAADEVQHMFDECSARIKSISMVHDQLYRAHDLAAISLDEYLKKLVNNIAAIHDAGARRINLKIETPSVIVAIDTASFCGLVVNELLSNVFEHAFEREAGGSAHVKLEIRAGGELRLEVSDDGVGLPASIDYKNPGTLGLELVNIFVAQISGTLAVERNAGTTVSVVFPIGAGDTRDRSIA